ncbi:MAG: nuclear transport factor 2 family protein [Planctomycetales bacterium]|nr:nuclear transport factor 2 family protein [Planctomycetales bacterium]
MSRPTSRFFVWATVICALGVATAPAWGQNDAGQSSVRAAGDAYLAAVQQGDAAAIADSWTNDGVFIDAAGNRFEAAKLAQDEFDKEVEADLQAAPAAVESTILLASPTVAIEQGRAAPTPDAEELAASRVQFLAVWVKQDERWRLRLLREFVPVAAAETSAAATNPLPDFEWMIGRWTAVDDEATIEFTAEWTADGKFLVQRFEVQRAGSRELSGTQRIGWDPIVRRVRSWTFHADGGFSEALWRQEGDVWVAESRGAAPDGRRTKAIHFWTPESQDLCWFKSLRGETGGRPADDLVLKFSRAPAGAP